jgi:hypothetical protein
MNANSMNTPVNDGGPAFPSPEASKPDSYAELKAAHAAGKRIQFRNANSSGAWSGWHDYDGGKDMAAPMPNDSHGGYREWRIKPSSLNFQLPPPPPGMSWHRTDGWTAEMLPQGYRPLIEGEKIQRTYDSFTHTTYPQNMFVVVLGLDDQYPANPKASFYRTTRPLVFTHEDKTWTWHRPGDPMPCDGDKEVNFVMKIDWRTCATIKAPAWKLRWSSIGDSSDIIGWRYADEPKTVDLGPEDVPRADSVTCSECNWTNVSLLNLGDLGKPRWICHGCCKRAFQKIDTLQSLVGAWEPCHKPG